MQLPAPLIPARLIRRYKRFLADVLLEEGQGAARETTVLCPNPGRMIGLDAPDSRIWLSRSDNPKRKYALTWELSDLPGGLVGINTNLPNGIAAEALEKDRIEDLRGYESHRREVRYGANSRVDFLLESPGRAPCYLEIKNCHLMREPGLAEFPDAVTARGLKHLEELGNMVEQGARAVMLYVVQREDCARFAPAGDIDPAYAEGLTRAKARGVEMLAYSCKLSRSEIFLDKPLETLI
ncbi:MAG: DNA/RNA nuclease SfsA [Limibacillus sp.]|jgi:sugar fermentation stimulation protein A